MKISTLILTVIASLSILSLISMAMAVDLNPEDPLPSWNEGKTKAAILNFVANTTNQSHPDYVEPEERIATFDNDGTLWCEYPDYVQSLYVRSRAGYGGRSPGME